VAPIMQVRGVTKDFVLPHLRVTTLKSRALHLFRSTRTVEQQHALSEITFDVDRGEFLGVVGRNGSGKSTLLKIMAGIYAPTKGEVITNGRLVPFIELGVGFNPELTGRENVFLNGALLGFSKPEVAQMYDEIVAFAELEESMDQKLKNYSSGMQVRIAFSTATKAKGDIMLIDEVLAVGDADFQAKCFEHFRALKKAGTTIIFVSHDMAAVRAFCDRAILIEDSRLMAEGTADEIAAKYMQLFMRDPRTGAKADGPEASDKPGGDERRAGNGDAYFSEVSAEDVLAADTPLTIHFGVSADADVADVLYSLIVRDAEGRPVAGLDSAALRPQWGSLRSGDRLRGSWEIANVFPDGDYTVELAITDALVRDVYDWWVDAVAFTVAADRQSASCTIPPSRLEITPRGT
jgi:ABC-2 type transport system ATP-binding protein